MREYHAIKIVETTFIVTSEDYTNFGVKCGNLLTFYVNLII
jgi:hypothetical protein